MRSQDNLQDDSDSTLLLPELVECSDDDLREIVGGREWKQEETASKFPIDLT